MLPRRKRYKSKSRVGRVPTRADIVSTVKPRKFNSKWGLINGSTVTSFIDQMREAGFQMREDWIQPYGFDLIEGRNEHNQRVTFVAME